MKNRIKLFVLISFLLFGCVKELRYAKRCIKVPIATTSDGVIIPSEEYLSELERVSDFAVGLMANANFGRYPTQDDDPAVSMSLATYVDFDLVLSGQKFPFRKNKCGTHCRKNKCVSNCKTHFKKNKCVSDYYGTHLLELYGKVHEISITAKKRMETYKFYIPELITTYVSSDSVGNGIKRTGSILHWNPDSQYPAKVEFTYRLYDGDPMYGNIIDANIIFIDDNGELDLSPFLANENAKAINLSIMRRNAIEVNIGRKKVALAFTSVDHWIYAIKD